MISIDDIQVDPSDAVALDMQATMTDVYGKLVDSYQMPHNQSPEQFIKAATYGMLVFVAEKGLSPIQYALILQDSLLDLSITEGEE